MNGSTALNEQLIGKFHIEKLPNNILINADETNITSTSTTTTTDEQTCPSRFQMIRVDRNFGRGRWKVHDYETPENTTALPVSSVTNPENESNSTKTQPTLINSDSTLLSTTSITNGFPPKTAPTTTTTTTAQPRLSITNTPLILPASNVPSPAGLIHAYPGPPPGALPNLTASTQSYLLTHHHPHPQFGYFPFYVPPYSPYAAQWAALAAANPYLAPPSIIPATTTTSKTINDSIAEVINETAVVTSTTEHLNNPSAAIATTPFLYAPHHSHSPYVPQHAAAVTSPYATIPSYHPVAPLPTIVPPTNANISTTSSETTSSQQAPLLSSPKHDSNKTNLIQQSALIITPQATNSSGTSTTNHTEITDLISTSPLLTSTEQTATISLISPMITSNSQDNANHANTTTSFPDIWSYTNGGSPLNLTQTAAAAICLLNNENNSNTEITNEILKELTTPTKQKHTADIDNKISAAMDLVKMHLLSAVREEVTELRERIRTLQEKITSIEHENAFLRQHVSNEIYAQYIPFVSISDSSQSIGTL